MGNILLAYHLTFGTYGTRLHGDERGSVDRQHNEHGTPFLEHDPGRQLRKRQLLRAPAVNLDEAQRTHVEHVMPEICRRGGWLYHIAACQPDHVHVLLTADFEGKAVRKWLKRWTTQSLTECWPQRQTWFAKGGSVRHIWDERYFNEAFRYIEEQRLTAEGKA